MATDNIFYIIRMLSIDTRCTHTVRGTRAQGHLFPQPAAHGKKNYYLPESSCNGKEPWKVRLPRKLDLRSIDTADSVYAKDSVMQLAIVTCNIS